MQDSMLIEPFTMKTKARCDWVLGFFSPVSVAVAQRVEQVD